MNNTSALIIIPLGVAVLGGVVVLLIEYWVIQPLRQRLSNAPKAMLPASQSPPVSTPANPQFVDVQWINAIFGKGNWFRDNRYENAVIVYSLPSDKLIYFKLGYFTIRYPILRIDRNGKSYGIGETIRTKGTATVWFNGSLPLGFLDSNIIDKTLNTTKWERVNGYDNGVIVNKLIPNDQFQRFKIISPIVQVDQDSQSYGIGEYLKTGTKATLWFDRPLGP